MRHLLLVAAVLCTTAALTVSGSASSRQGGSQADNSSTNQRDRNPSEITADQQKENNSDLALAQQIRQSLVKDKSLSTYAHNVKVIAQNGKVTLKGPVQSEQEKETIVSKAAAIAGSSNVTDEINVVH